MSASEDVGGNQPSRPRAWHNRSMRRRGLLHLAILGISIVPVACKRTEPAPPSARPHRTPVPPGPGIKLDTALARLGQAGFRTVEQRSEVYLAPTSWILVHRDARSDTPAGDVHLTLQFLDQSNNPGEKNPPEDPPYLLVGNDAVLRLLWLPAAGPTVHRDLAADARAVLAIAPVEQLESELYDSPAYAKLAASWSLKEHGFRSGGADEVSQSTSRYFYGPSGSFTLQVYDFASGAALGRARLIGATLATVRSDDTPVLARAALEALAH